MYPFSVIYRKGTENSEADCLSRNPIDETTSNKDHIRVINLISLKTIKTEQQKLKFQILLNKKLFQENDIIYRKDPLFKRIYVPETLQTKLILEIHKQFCHPGINQTNLLISRNYFFENI